MMFYFMYTIVLCIPFLDANDQCVNKGCQNNAPCILASDGQPICSCGMEHMGDLCQYQNLCYTKPDEPPRCANEGTCRSVFSGDRSQWDCQCLHGYVGQNCSSIDPLSICVWKNPCKNGQCIPSDSNHDHFKCKCDPHRTGDRCELQDHCVPATSAFLSLQGPCFNGGRCVNNLHNYTCECPPNWTGKHCETDVDECSKARGQLLPPACANGGLCNNLIGSFECACSGNFTGPTCSQLSQPCQPNPCLNDAECLVTGQFSFKCRCRTGTYGVNCEDLVDNCPLQPVCRNGGQCVDGLDTFTCQCPSGFSGQFCEHENEFDECENEPCKNGATCTKTKSGYECICVQGWEGKNCTQNVNDCVGNPCLNGGVCQDLPNSKFKCKCQPGWVGFSCEMVDVCTQRNPCNPERSDCIMNAASGKHICQCKQGFMGANCDIDIDECSTSKQSPCREGRCVDKPGRFECVCNVGYTGKHCDKNINECAPDPCRNSGTCLDDVGKYQCICMPGFDGINCTQNINDCRSDSCHNGGTCVDGVNSFMCLCVEPWRGLRCENRTTACDAKPCLQGTCISSSDGLSYQCRCLSGYTGRNCQENTNDCLGIVCHNGGTCIDGVDHFKCHCKSGFRGLYCENDVDECHENELNGIASCQNAGICVNTRGSFECQCPAGTSGPLCQDRIPPCFSNPCINGASCTNLANGEYRCKCRAGYSGRNCHLVNNECATRPCKNGATCIDLVAGFRCKCSLGFQGTLCEDQIKHCSATSCYNGAECINSDTGFICRCLPGFSGQLCETQDNACAANPCQHSGTCYSKSDFPHFRCACSPGYAGDNCEIVMSRCDQNPCGKNGRCVTTGVNQYRCYCNPLWNGTNCQFNTDPCFKSPCKNFARCRSTATYKQFSCDCNSAIGHFTGELCDLDVDECIDNPFLCGDSGRCINTYGAYQCECLSGWTGPRCDINKNECASSPCHNGAECHDLINAYRCVCMNGFTGFNCDINVDECLSRPCANGAVCIDHVASYECKCARGFSGRNCTVNDNDCSSTSCMNGGTCVDLVNGFKCLCPPNYVGQHCQQIRKSCATEKNPCLHGGICTDSADGNFRCDCVDDKWQGSRCETPFKWCGRMSEAACLNGGNCQLDSTGEDFICQCTREWIGRRCELKRGSTCEVHHNDSNMSSSVCKNGANCFNGEDGLLWCDCQPGFYGNTCDKPILPCGLNPCQNGATCHNLENGRYRCECQAGFVGRNCTKNVDDCAGSTQRCNNGGTCVDGINTFHCICPRGVSGLHCENDSINECVEASHKGITTCLNGGLCVDTLTGYRCNCPKGFHGRYCEGDVDECAAKLCHSPGTLDCLQNRGNFTCLCASDWRGTLCDKKIDFCAEKAASFGLASSSDLCLNGGHCVVDNLVAKCVCSSHWSGDFCNMTNLLCEKNPCANGARCLPIGEDRFQCLCPSGLSGVFCTTDIHNECLSNPCAKEAICKDLIGSFQCICPSGRCGTTCTEICPLPSSISPPTFNHDLLSCTENNCGKKGRNGRCDAECNLLPCKFDNGECSLSSVPWEQCTIILEHSVRCDLLYRNGKCDPLCNTEECLFDGHDCVQMQQAQKICALDDCADRFADGQCDIRCNNASCAYDGGDCDSASPRYASGLLMLVLSVSPDTFARHRVSFLRSLSQFLGAVLSVALDPQGQPMIYPTRVVSQVGTNSSAIVVTSHRIRRRSVVKSAIRATRVYLRVDSGACEKSVAAAVTQGAGCITKAKFAAQALTAAVTRGQFSSPLPLVEINSQDDPSIPPASSMRVPQLAVYIVVSAACVLIVSLLLGVLYSVANRKRAAPVWYPEGFFGSGSAAGCHRTHQRGGTDQSKSAGGGGGCSSSSSTSSASKVTTDSEVINTSLCTQSSAVVSSNHASPWDNKDRSATSKRPRNKLDVSDLGDESTTDDVDTTLVVSPIDMRDVHGLTALMVAASAGNAMPPACDDPQTATIVSDLLSAGASMQIRSKFSGETPLHLAARHSRIDAAQRLLDCGDDPNAVDAQGRSPLHAAIAADAYGVFHILLRHRRTDVNARTLDGTTPLIQAVKVCAEGTVEELVTIPEVDINLADNHGKSALHWAAAVNNDVAVRLLLANGVNKDALDCRERTPLLLAAREGAYAAAKLLIDAGANLEAADGLDRTPRQVAAQRHHGDIVQLLDTARRNLGTREQTNAVPKRSRHAASANVNSNKPPPLPPKQPRAIPQVSPPQLPTRSMQSCSSSSSPPSACEINSPQDATCNLYGARLYSTSPQQAALFQDSCSSDVNQPLLTAFGFSNSSINGSSLQYHLPSNNGNMAPIRRAAPFLTPSPDSPGQWSSCSQQSDSWSEDLASPPSLGSKFSALSGQHEHLLSGKPLSSIHSNTLHHLRTFCDFQSTELVSPTHQYQQSFSTSRRYPRPPAPLPQKQQTQGAYDSVFF